MNLKVPKFLIENEKLMNFSTLQIKEYFNIFNIFIINFYDTLIIKKLKLIVKELIEESFILKLI